MVAAGRILAALTAVALAASPAAHAAPRPAAEAADPVIAGAFTSAGSGSHPGRSGPLTAEERRMAEVAWSYFANNTQPATGLVNAVDRYPSATLWDAASAMAAIVSAGELGVIPRDEAQSRLQRLLNTLGELGLVAGKYPNKVYNTATGAPSDYANNPGEIGVSAIDIGRMLVWLRIVAQRYPALEAKIAAIPPRWTLAELVRDGSLYGAVRGADGGLTYLQEGRLGYEEYAAAGFALWGHRADAALAAAPYHLIQLYGVAVPFDARDPREFGAHNYVVTESYVLHGIELGWDDPSDVASGPFTHTSGWIASAAQRIYLAQQRRFERTGILTARTEHQLLGDPYFVYDTVFTDGQPWATITETGRNVPEHAAVALKGAFGLWALWETPYTDRLLTAVKDAHDPARGWQEGVLEKGGRIEAYTANNNGIILETLLYKVQGKLLRPR
jgi:hypothetical protein